MFDWLELLTMAVTISLVFRLIEYLKNRYSKKK